MPDITHAITLRVGVSTPEEFSEVWEAVGVISNGLGLKYPEVGVSSYLVEQYEEEVHTEDTLFKVRAALREADVDEAVIDNLINSMQNFGILFRERAT